MRVHDISDATGQVVQFEVANAGLTRRRACEVLSRVEGCRILTRPRAWSWARQDCFCVAEVNGVKFTIEEPFGDNSRYLVSPLPPTPVPELRAVRGAFEAARETPVWLRLALLAGFAALVAALVLVRR